MLFRSHYSLLAAVVFCRFINSFIAGGQSSLADYCTYFVAYSDGSCTDTSSARAPDRMLGEVQGIYSRSDLSLQIFTLALICWLFLGCLKFEGQFVHSSNVGVWPHRWYEPDLYEVL